MYIHIYIQIYIYIYIYVYIYITNNCHFPLRVEEIGIWGPQMVDVILCLPQMLFSQLGFWFSLECWAVYTLTRGLFWSLFINTKTTLKWARKQFVTRVHRLLYLFTRHNESIKTTMLTHRPHVSLARLTFFQMTSQLIVDDVTMTRQLWRGYVKSDI